MVNNEEVEIRLAGQEDFNRIFEIWLDGLQSSFDTSGLDLNVIRGKLELTFSQKNGIFNFWVAIDKQNNILGWQSLIKCFYHPLKDDFFAESSTYISNSNRYGGIGKKLLSHVIKEAENSSLKYIIGFISDDNIAVKKMIQELGWHEVGTIPKSVSEKDDRRKKILIRPV